MSGKGKVYSQEIQDQVLKECLETDNYGSVAKKHDIPVSTVYTWVNRFKSKDKITAKKAAKSQEKELADAKLEIRILKELLKKSHQLWLKD